MTPQDGFTYRILIIQPIGLNNFFLHLILSLYDKSLSSIELAIISSYIRWENNVKCRHLKIQNNRLYAVIYIIMWCLTVVVWMLFNIYIETFSRCLLQLIEVPSTSQETFIWCYYMRSISLSEWCNCRCCINNFVTFLVWKLFWPFMVV